MNNLFKIHSSALFFVAILFLIGCGTTVPFRVNQTALKQIQRVAVLSLTVPTQILFREDPRYRQRGALLWSLINLRKSEELSANPKEAATIAHHHFASQLNMMGLPFTVMSQEEMLKNGALLEVAKKFPLPNYDIKRPSWWERLFPINRVVAGISPDFLPTFGLIKHWEMGANFKQLVRFRSLITEITKILKVDGVIIISDGGYSFACNGCVYNSGLISTNSAFNVALLNTKGRKILDLSDYFVDTGVNAQLVEGKIKPEDYLKLYQGHGVKMAKIFAHRFKINMLLRTRNKSY